LPPRGEDACDGGDDDDVDDYDDGAANTSACTLPSSAPAGRHPFCTPDSVSGAASRSETCLDPVVVALLYQVYHQYHDDMVEKYGSEYGSLRAKGVERGAFAPTGCPEIGF